MKYEDGGVFGPVTFDQIRQWAVEAQISPLDKLSTDESTWLKAPMIPELQMDFLIEVSPDQYYGPTTIGALKEFMEMGEIGPETLITNCKDGSSRAVKDFPDLQPSTSSSGGAQQSEPIRTNIRVSLQQRIRDLEHSLLEERRAREAAEKLVEKLEARLAELTANT